MLNLSLRWLPFEGTIELVRRDDYIAPPGNQVGLNFGGAYEPPQGNQIGLEFVPSDDPVSEQQYLFPVGTDQTVFGTAEFKLQVRYLLPGGIPSTLTFGTPTLHNYDTHARPSGFNASAFGTASLRNLNRYVTAAGFDSQAFGTASILNWNKTLYPSGFNAAQYGISLVANTARLLRPSGFHSFSGISGISVLNWRRYLRPSGGSYAAYGQPMLLGGVRYLRPNGSNYMAVGLPGAINTTADQTARPSSIPPPPVGTPSLSPHTIFASGFLAGRSGEPLVQRNPSPHGFETLRVGQAAIDYKTKWAYPDGIAYGEWVGYPRVFDRAQRVQVSSVIEAGIFGDTAIRNRTLLVSVPGTDFFEPSAWTSVESNRRELPARGWDAAAFGGTFIENATPSFAPFGFDSLAPGVPGIGFAVRYIQVPGFRRTAYGSATVTKTPELKPGGINSAAVGSSTIWNRIRTLEAKGADAQRFGDNTVWFSFRHVAGQGFGTARYGTATLTHSLRTLLAQGADHSRYGQPRLSNANRTISPQGIFENFAHQHMVGGTRWLLPRGFEATAFGSRIIPEITQVYPQGFQGVFGTPELENLRKLVQPHGITTGVQPADRWGTARTFNLRQYIEQTFDPQSGLVPPAWPQWMRIENRNRFIGTAGRDESAFGYAGIVNNARVLNPEPIAAPQTPAYYQAGMISHRIRYLPIEGMEPPYISGWGRVYNDAFVIAPDGVQPDAFGVAALENTRRYFRWIGGFEAAEFGEPMIAYRIRELTFEHRYTIAPPYVRLPTVDLYTRYVEPLGFDGFGQGWASLSIHWTIITPRWTHRDLLGSPAVKNLTPELHTRGRPHDEFGLASLRTQWRTVEAHGSDTAVFGRGLIADRDRSFAVAGIYRGGFGRVRMVGTGAPPYSEQIISLRGPSSETGQEGNGYGIAPPFPQAGEPTLNQAVLYPSGRAMDMYGTATVTSNGILMEFGIAQYRYGTPVVDLKRRTVTVEPFRNSEVYEPSPARVSPHTIWAVREAPAQAINNHPSRRLHYVDQYPTGAGWRKGVGHPRVVQPGLSVARPGGIGAPTLGRPSLFNKRHYVRVNGIQAYRFGWHSLGDGTIHVGPFGRPSSIIFGQPVLTRPPYLGPQQVRPAGLAPPAVAQHRVSHFHRELRMTGFSALQMGSSRGGTLYLPQSLNVGPRRPTIPAGVDMARAGEPWISFRVREIQPPGDDFFLSEYDVASFGSRMRVRNAYTYVPPLQSVSPVGIGESDLGVPNVLRGTHYILPDGNADQYRKGAF